MRWNSPTIETVMTRTPTVVAPEDTLASASHAMLLHRIRHVPVCEAGRVVGVLSQRDVYYTQAHRDDEHEVVRVADAMTPFVYVVPPTALVEEVARDLADAKYGAAVVVAKELPIGVFTTTDGMRALAEVLADLRRAERAARAAATSLPAMIVDLDAVEGER